MLIKIAALIALSAAIWALTAFVIAVIMIGDCYEDAPCLTDVERTQTFVLILICAAVANALLAYAMLRRKKAAIADTFS